MRRFLLLAIATASAIAPQAVPAQTYPVKPVTLVSPFAAGGTSDVVSRAIGTRMSTTLGQPVIIVNRTGAGGTIGIGSTAAAPPDGYTLVMGGLGSVVFSAGVYGTKLKFDPQKQLEPIAPVAVVPTVIVVRADSPFKTLGELVQTAKAHPGKVRYGSAGVGGTLHIAGELFERVAKVELTHVPYKGGAPAVIDLLAGNIEAVFGDVTLVKSYIEAGKVRALAVAGAQRSPFLPDVPTTAELGLPGVVVDTWYAVFAPKGVPPATAERLREAIAAAVTSPEVLKVLQSQGLTPLKSSPAQFAGELARDFEKWVPLVREVCKAGCD